MAESDWVREWVELDGSVSVSVARESCGSCRRRWLSEGSSSRKDGLREGEREEGRGRRGRGRRGNWASAT